MIHASNKVVFTQEKQHSLHGACTEQGEMFLLQILRVYYHSYGSSVVVIMAFSPLLLKFSRVKERTGSKPIFCGLGTCHRVWMVDLQSNRSHHLRVQITSTVPMGLVVTQIVNQRRCRTGLFTDKTPSHFLTVRQNVGEFGSSDFFEQEAIIGCAQCGLDLIINMTIFTLSPPGSP